MRACLQGLTGASVATPGNRKSPRTGVMRADRDAWVEPCRMHTARMTQALDAGTSRWQLRKQISKASTPRPRKTKGRRFARCRIEHAREAPQLLFAPCPPPCLASASSVLKFCLPGEGSRHQNLLTDGTRVRRTQVA